MLSWQPWEAISAGPTAVPSAADGDQLSACKDGRCEVVVTLLSTIQLNSETNLYAVAVSSIDNDEIRLFISMRGDNSFGCDDDDRCQVSTQGRSGQNPPWVRFSAHPGAHLTVAKLNIQVIAVLDEKAVLRLTLGQ